MYTLYTDVHYSRRKNFHHIFDENDEPRWTGTHITSAFQWLLDNGEDTFKMFGKHEDQLYFVTLKQSGKHRPANDNG